jgi:hypothetical protein
MGLHKFNGRGGVICGQGWENELSARISHSNIYAFWKWRGEGINLEIDRIIFASIVHSLSH